jgi:hypothetical protein
MCWLFKDGIKKKGTTNNLVVSNQVIEVDRCGLCSRRKIPSGNLTPSELFELLLHPAGNNHCVAHRGEVD